MISATSACNNDHVQVKAEITTDDSTRSQDTAAAFSNNCQQVIEAGQRPKPCLPIQHWPLWALNWLSWLQPGAKASGSQRLLSLQEMAAKSIEICYKPCARRNCKKHAWLLVRENKPRPLRYHPKSRLLHKVQIASRAASPQCSFAFTS